MLTDLLVLISLLGIRRFLTLRVCLLKSNFKYPNFRYAYNSTNYCNDYRKLAKLYSGKKKSGGGVEVGSELHADGLEEGHEVVAREVLGAIEGHVFDKVGQSLLVVVLVTAGDDCDPTPSLSFDEQMIDGTCEDILIRTWTAADRCANATC